MRRSNLIYSASIEGGFGFKYVVYSGREPGEKASPDGVLVKLLGYKWDSKNDILYP